MNSISKSLQEIDSDRWVIASHLLLTRQPAPVHHQPSWNDGTGGFFVLSESTQLLPKSKPLSEESVIRKVYEAGTVSTVWKIGEAFLKVKKVRPSDTREHITLDYLHTQGSLGFNIPTVYYHTELGGRYIAILSSLPGKTLAEAWANLGEATRDGYVHRIATICCRMTAWTGDKISGVDGNHLSDLFLCKDTSGHDCEPQRLRKNCQELGMDCSSLVFYHCDLGPGNIIINPTDGSIGIIDWETAGYVPIDWVRTKFCLSSGMDLPAESVDARQEWRKKVARCLGDMGFSEVADTWLTWWTS